MPEITNHTTANAQWSEFENQIAKLIPAINGERYEYVISLAQELIYAALDSDIAPCMNRDDHQFSGDTYSACVKCGEPEH